jgi:hypothetical protein
MARKDTKTKATTSPPAVKMQKRNKVAYEMWLTKKASRGPMEDRLAAEGLLLKDLQGRGRPRLSQKAPKRKASK